MALTKLKIDRSIYKVKSGERYVLWDSNPTGLGLRIYPSGRKAFILSYRIQNVKKLMTIGDYGILTLQQARDIARKHLGKVVEGKDPLEERKRISQGETIKDLCEIFLERYAKAKKRSWKDDQRRIKSIILPEWGTRKILSITKSDVEKLHNKVGKTAKYQANRLVALLAVMFRLAQEWGMVDGNSTNPAKGIKKFSEHKRDRWLRPEELPLLAEAIHNEQNVYVQGALWLYLLTGLRKSELLSAKWDDVDFQRGELKLLATKSGNTHYVPLSEPAKRILKKIPIQLGNPYIFPGKINGAPLVNISKPWQRIRTKACLPDVRLHDLRRTVGSWLAQSGDSLQVIGSVLNHKHASTTQIYARLAEDQSRKALDRHACKLRETVTIEIGM